MSAAPLAGRGAVVTGGGRGIGAAVARGLSAAGAAVVVAARTEAEIAAVAEALAGAGHRAFAIACDVTREASVRDLFARARAALGAVDVLVNDAGVGASAPLAKITLEEWNRMLAVNATGAFLCMREALPDMRARGFGRIVNVASLAGLEGVRYAAHYAASKHALIGLTRSAALECAGTGVTVNAVCPGYADTPMTERTLANVEARARLSRADALAAVLATTGQDRLVDADEVARAVLALCTEASAPNGREIPMRPRSGSR